MPVYLENLPKAVATLEKHPEASRIKKFVYYIYKQIAEEAPASVDAYSLEQLLTELINAKPTIKRLALSMYGFIQRLEVDRQEAYAKLAKGILDQLSPVYQANKEDVENTEIGRFLQQRQGDKPKNQARVSINLMETVVKKMIFQELTKLPSNVSKTIEFEDVVTYVLNRLPPLYISSEEEKQRQLQKVKELQDKIQTTVSQGIAAVMQDPLRRSTPLDLDAIDPYTEAYATLKAVEEFTSSRGDTDQRSSLNDVSQVIIDTLNDYEESLADLETFLQIHNLLEDKLTVKNLAFNMKKVIRRLLR